MHTIRRLTAATVAKFLRRCEPCPKGRRRLQVIGLTNNGHVLRVDVSAFQVVLFVDR